MISPTTFSGRASRSAYVACFVLTAIMILTSQAEPAQASTKVRESLRSANTRSGSGPTPSWRFRCGRSTLDRVSALRIDVWSDVVCPWCWVGKRRLEAALRDFGKDIEIVWRAFELD